MAFNVKDEPGPADDYRDSPLARGSSESDAKTNYVGYPTTNLTPGSKAGKSSPRTAKSMESDGSRAHL